MAVAALCAFSGSAAAQTATGRISGVVIEARTAVPLAAVLVQVESTRQRALSDEEGRFVLDNVPVGQQWLVVSVVGFGLVRREVTVSAGLTTELTIPVAEGASTYVEEVAVTAGRFRDAQPGTPSQAVLGSRELLALRGVIADDPFRAVQVLPGVAAGDDYRAEFAVRGLGPYHVGLAIDDVDSRLLFHTVRGVTDTGSLALINSDILEEATLLSGAHPQKLGSHLGARLDFRTRDGARDRLHGRFMVSGSATTTVWEGPLGSGERGSWLLAGRKSYIDWILRRVDTSIEGTFGFIDGQAKLTLNPTPRQTLRLSIIGGQSELDEDDEPSLNAFDRGRSRTFIGNIQWRYLPSAKFGLTQQLYLVESRYLNRVADGRAREEGGDRDVTWRASAEWSPAAQHFVEGGVQAQALAADRIDRRFTSATSSVLTINAHPTTSSQAGWMSHRWTPSPVFVTTLGARVEHWKLAQSTSVSPWLLAEVKLSEQLKLRGGAAVQRQAPGFDENLLARSGDTITPERARIVDLGIEWQFGSAWRASVTGYHRRERDLLRVLNAEFKIVNDRIVRPGPPFVDNALTGTSKGAEVVLERRSANGLNGWLSYAWGRSTVNNSLPGPPALITLPIEGETYAADYDQRHTLNANVAFRWSERSSIAARYRLGSNFPIQGYIVERGDIYGLGTERNATRLPAYARLDVRADRSFTYRRSRLTVFVEVVNVTNRANYRAQSAGPDTRTGEIVGLREKLFPILPSAGVLIEF